MFRTFHKKRVHGILSFSFFISLLIITSTISKISNLQFWKFMIFFKGQTSQRNVRVCNCPRSIQKKYFTWTIDLKKVGARDFQKTVQVKLKKAFFALEFAKRFFF